VVDLGCHLGTFAIPTAILGRRVLAVDASSLHTNCLETSRQLGGIDNLTVVRSAVSDRDGHVSFREDGLFGRIEFNELAQSDNLVPAKTLRNLLKEQAGFDKPAMIKIDIEGCELLALQSVADLLRADDGPAILYESNEPLLKLAGTSVSKLRAWLEDHGMKTFRIEAGRWVYSPPPEPQPEMWTDVLALNESQQERFRDRIDREWSAEAMLDRFRAWLALPDPPIRAHVSSVLNDRSVTTAYPYLRSLALPAN
jgi:FkbM family methyltransferase